MNKDKLKVAGVTINRDDPRVANVKKLEDVKKLHIFSHLSGEKKEAAEVELLEKIINTEVDEEIPAASASEAHIAELEAKDPEDLTEAEVSELEGLKKV